jgi:hypothetical protein
VPGDEVTDALPRGLELLEVTSTAGTTEGDLSANRFSWNGAVAAGAEVEIYATARVGRPGFFANQAVLRVDLDGDGRAETERLSHPPGGEGPTTVVTPGASIPTARTLGILVLAAAMLWIGWSTLQRS